MTVSILIPVFRTQDYIIKCLSSVSNQTYKGDLECLIVDDCGKDNSIQLVKEFIASYVGNIRFDIIHHTFNRGLAAARNTAIENARGEYIIHLDSDDWLEPDAVENLVKKQIETNADIVSGNAIAHYSDREELMREPEYTDRLLMMRHMVELTMDHVIWRRLIRRSLYVNNRIKCVEGVNIGEDHHTLPLLIYYAENCVKLEAVVYHYNCQNVNSYMRKTDYSHLVKMMKSDLASINILLQFFEDKDYICMQQLWQSKANYAFKCMKCCFDNKDIKLYNYMANEFFDIDSKFLQSFDCMKTNNRLVNRYLYLVKLFIDKVRVKLYSGSFPH